MGVLAAILLFTPVPVTAADETPQLRAAVRECASEFLERPSVSVSPWDVLITYEESFHQSLEQTVAIKIDNGNFVAKYFRANGAPYYSQCADFFKRRPAAIEDRRLLRRELDSLAHDFWPLAPEECPALKKDMTRLPEILRSSADELQKRIEKKPRTDERPTKITIRADGPSYRIVVYGELGKADIRPRANSDMERFVEAVLKHSTECVANKKAGSQ